MAIDINALIKQYTNPWDTSFNYVDASGNVLGKGYDSYQDAIRKLAFSTGLQEHTPQAGRTEADPIYGITNELGTENWSYNDPFMKDLPGGFGWLGNYTAASSNMGTEILPSPETRGQTYGTSLELWNALNNDPAMLDKLTYDSKEKYGRELTEGQLQNMYARYASGNLKGAVPDWEYHREAYNSPGIGAGYSNAEQPASGYAISGEQALIGSTPVFGADGKITGYKINMNPEHISGADTSGRVRSSSNGATMFDPSLAQYITDAGGGYGFLDASNVDKFGYRSVGNSTYEKEQNFFDKYMPGLIQSAALGGTLAGVGGLFDPTTAAGTTGTTGTTGVAAGSGGTTGGTGMFDDIFSWLSNSFGGATDAASGWDFGPLSDTVLNGGVDAASGLNLDQMVNYMSSGWDFGPLSDSLINGGVDPVSGMTLDQMKPGLLDAVKNYLTQNPGSTLKTAAQALLGGGSGGGLLGGTGTGQGSLLGALLGGLAGSYGGAKQDGTINTTQTPWGPQQPYLLDAWEKAKQASNNPINTQAQSNYQSVLQGPTTNPYLGQDNPYLQKQIDNTNADVTRAMMPAMNQANKASGSFGNSGVADIYSKNMTDAYSRNANDMRFKDYYAQMQLQKDAVNNTLGFTQGTSNFLAGPAQDYAKTVQGNYGGTKSEPYFTNPASSILGGATLGYNLFGR
jgi:hypothetical protein